MMKFKVSKDVEKVVRDNLVKICDLDFKVSDDEAVKIKEYVENLLSGKNVSAPSTVVEKNDDDVTFDPIGEKRYSTDLADVYYDKKSKTWRVYFEYKNMKSWATSEQKYKNWKKYLAKEVYNLGGKRSEDGNFCYILPNEKTVKEYFEIRKKNDEERKNRK